MIRLVLAFICLSGVARGVTLKPEPRLCTEFFRSDLVFSGKVISATRAKEDKDGIGGWDYRIQVENMFRGEPQEFVTVFTENSSGRYMLKMQHEYLLFADNIKGRMWISDGGNNRDVTGKNDKFDDVKLVISNNKAGKPGDIRGWLGNDDGMVKGSGFGVTVEATDGKRHFTAVVNNKGWFHIYVPAGTYQVVPHSSEKYEIIPFDLSYNDPNHVVVECGGCGEVAFRARRR